MKIVHAVRSDAFGGVERYIAAVAPRLAARGVGVRVIGGEPTAMRRALGDHARFAPGDTTVAVAAALRRERADIVHVHMTAAELAAAIAAPRDQIVVGTRHFLGRRGNSLGGRLASLLISRRLRFQISVSDAVAASIGEDSTRIYNGVASRPAGAHQSTTVLVLQRLEAEKDTALALHAWARTRARLEGWTLEIAGDGSQRASLEQLARSLGIEGSVRFLGHVADPEAHLAHAGILLATAACEPFGLSVVEAMAAATPVVASAAGGHLETVGAVAGTFTFASGDAAGCAQRLDELAHDAAARAAYGARLQERQRAAFDIEDHVSALIELYERLA